MRTTRPVRGTVVGASPGGICTRGVLSKTELDVSIDVFERLPAPFGHPRELVLSEAGGAVGHATPGNVVAA